jgi:hypothetical protein
MTPLTGAERHAQLVLRLLLGEAVSAAALAAVSWTRLARLADRNAVVIRLAERLAALGLHPLPALAELVERERGRARAVLDLLPRLRQACARHDIPWLVPKALERYPDVGDDLDLLVLARTAAVDRLLLEGLRVTRRLRTIANRLAGKTVYEVSGAGIILDIRHGRLGSAGQHAGYSAVVFQNRRPAAIGGTEVFVPSPEDALVLQGMEKVIGRRAFHLCDVLHTVVTIQTGGLDWDYVARAARAHGGAAGLCCYLRYVDQIFGRLVGGELLPAEARRALLGNPRGWGRARFRDAGFRFPALWVTGRIHGRQLARAVRERDWDAVARLGAWPAAALLRRLTRFLARLSRPAVSGRPAFWPATAEGRTP